MNNKKKFLLPLVITLLIAGGVIGGIYLYEQNKFSEGDKCL